MPGKWKLSGGLPFLPIKRRAYTGTRGMGYCAQKLRRGGGGGGEKGERGSVTNYGLKNRRGRKE